MQYDADGSVQLNTLSDMMNAAIRQDSARLGNDVEQFTKKFVYGPLGMTESTWSGGAPNKQIANTWSTTVHDMARIGLLMLNHGMWNGERLVAAEWIYRMTQSFVRGRQHGLRVLAWVNSSSNHNYGLIGGAPVGPQQGAAMPGPCAPVAVFASHPHGSPIRPVATTPRPTRASSNMTTASGKPSGAPGK